MMIIDLGATLDESSYNLIKLVPIIKSTNVKIFPYQAKNQSE